MRVLASLILAAAATPAAAFDIIPPTTVVTANGGSGDAALVAELSARGGIGTNFASGITTGDFDEQLALAFDPAGPVVPGRAQRPP